MSYSPEEKSLNLKEKSLIIKEESYPLTNINSKERETLNSEFQPKKQIAIAYMVAGMSSRFGGKIKQFARIGPDNETLIEYSINQAIKAGFNKIIFIVGEKTKLLFREMFGNNYKEIPIEYTFQNYDKEKRDRPWGTVDAVCTLKGINHPVVVCNGDDIYGEETFQILFNHLKNNNHEATVGYSLLSVIPEHGAVHRGVFKINKDNQIIDLKETFNIEKSKLHLIDINPNDLVSMNIWALFPESIEKLNQQLEKFRQTNFNSRTAECLLPDEIGNLIKTNQIKMQLYPTNSKWFGVTSPDDEIKVRESLAQ